jgi:hypothetical protein
MGSQNEPPFHAHCVHYRNFIYPFMAVNYPFRDTKCQMGSQKFTMGSQWVDQFPKWAVKSLQWIFKKIDMYRWYYMIYVNTQGKN